MATPRLEIWSWLKLGASVAFLLGGNHPVASKGGQDNLERRRRENKLRIFNLSLKPQSPPFTTDLHRLDIGFHISVVCG